MTTGSNDSIGLNNEDVNKFFSNKTITCPVCNRQSKNKTVRKSSYKVIKRDTDSMLYYSGTNPSYYEVVYCPECGYAALPQFFESIGSKGKSLILENISSKWSRPNYPDQFDVHFAIQQHKLALHNATIKESTFGEKGVICLQLSWLYRSINDIDNEKRFQEQTIACFEQAYLSENFPIAGLDIYSIQFLIGELCRRLENDDKALKYFSQILISTQAPQKLKEKVRDQKNLINKK